MGEEMETIRRDIEIFKVKSSLRGIKSRLHNRKKKSLKV